MKRVRGKIVTDESGMEVLKLGTNPLNPDTDGDSIPDGEELQYWNETRKKYR